MKQVILMSIQPKWVAKILNGEKTVEIRKTALHEGDEVHIYVTKGKPYLYDYDGFHLTPTRSWSELHDNGDREWFSIDEVGELNGKVVAKFIVGKVEKIKDKKDDVWICFVGKENRCYFDNRAIYTEELGKWSCLTEGEMAWYGVNTDLYALEITHLEIFDRPRELGEFHFTKEYKKAHDFPEWWDKPITHAPQSWMYCEVEDGTTDMEAISDTNKLSDNLKTMERLKKESEEK